MRNDKKTSWTDGSILDSANSSEVNSLYVSAHSKLWLGNYTDNLDSFSFFKGLLLKVEAQELSLSKISWTPKKALMTPEEMLSRDCLCFSCSGQCCLSPGA